MGAFDLDIYDRIYQVIIYKKKRRLQIFHSAFECKDSIFWFVLTSKIRYFLL